MSGFANEGRLRLQESALARPIRAEVSEGRLRNTEIIGAVERAASNSASTTVSEARHRLQEGTLLKSFQTASVEIPHKTATVQVATSVPNTGTARAVGISELSDLSTSLKKPTSKVSPSKTKLSKDPPAAQVNPFKGDDYDETKNPFADEQPSNPFGEDDDDYNDSLNPFAE